MDDDRQLQTVLAALLALATAFLGVSTWRDGLSSHRPPVDLQSLSAGVGQEDVLARLWEDPITAVNAAAREHGGRFPNHEPQVLGERIVKTLESQNDVAILPVMVDGTPFAEDLEARLRLRYALAAALTEEGFTPEARTTVGFLHMRWPRAIETNDRGTSPLPAGGWLVLPPAGGWLAAPPLQPIDVAVRQWLPLQVGADLWGNDDGASLLVPFEWWTRPPSPPHVRRSPMTSASMRSCDGPARITPAATRICAPSGPPEPSAAPTRAPHVLVLWLPEERFADSPLERLRRLLAPLLERVVVGQVDVALIGPRSSDTLHEMSMPQHGEAPRPPIRRLRIISPSATAPDVLEIAFGSAEDRGILAAARDSFPAGNITSTSSDGGGPLPVEAINLAAPDDHLALALVDELENRGIDVRGGDGSPHRILLLSEADTIYGRALPRAFAAAAATDRTTASGQALRLVRANYHRQRPPASNILRYSYLRGLDGRTARASAEKKDDDKRQSSVEEAVRRVVSPIGQAAEGEIQFDYIERLARELKQRDDEWAADSSVFDRAGIRAIGILGSDPWDKLVILQALRPRFPEAVFFTTDLDGRLWDGGSGRLTHNMIVASAFDPFRPLRRDSTPESCGESYREPEFPPFRDSAQAGLFHAVRLAVAPTRTPQEPEPPVLYEIGRTRPVKLLGASERGAVRRWLSDLQWVGLIFLFGGSGGLWAMWRRQEGKGIPSPVCPRTARTVDCAIAGLQARSAAVALYYGGFMLGVLVLAIGVIGRLSNRPGGEPLALGQGVSVWPTEFLRVVIVLLIIGLVWRAWLHHRTYRLIAWRDFFAPEDTAGSAPPDFTTGGGSESGTPPGWVSAQWAFWEYVGEAQLKQRLIRAGGASLAYLLFGFGVFFLWGTPVRPVRGPATGWIDLTCLFSSILAFNFLTFYVLDTTLVTRRLLNRLAEKPTRWPDHVVLREADRLGLEEALRASPAAGTSPLGKAMEGLIDVRYAALHTADLGGRLYLPFVVMLLMVVARSRIFDNWGWPPSLIVINVCGLLLVLVCAFLLRRTAARVRADAIDRLTPLIVAARGRGSSGGERPNLADLESIRDAIAGIKRGAYAQLRYDPAVLSVLIPTGGYGLFVLACEFVVGVQ